MTVYNAYHPRPARRQTHPRAAMLRTGILGLAVGLLAAVGGVHAGAATAVGTVAQSGAVSGSDPAKRLPGGVEVANIDFRRGEGGSGKLVVRFTGDGAVADLQNQGSQVVLDLQNAQLPASLARPLDVSDFATPVDRVEARNRGNGSILVLQTSGPFESLAYQSGNEYIVEVVPRAAPARAMGQTVDTGTSVSTVEQRSYSGRPVTFNFQDVPVRTVLQLIAEESNLNIVASDSVTGNVTLRLINVPWDQALDIVLRAKGLDKRRSGNVVWVAPQSEIAKYEQDVLDARIAVANRADMVTEYIPINYANAEDIATLLTEGAKSGTGGGAGAGAGGQARGFLSPRGSISFDRRTNTLLVIDIPDKVVEIKRLVSLLDKPVDQVLIEARIVIATESFARELGAKFGLSGATGKPGDRSSLGFGSNTVQSGQNAISRAEAGGVRPWDITPGLNVNLPTSFANAGALALSILNAGYLLDVELSALQQEGRGEVISNPRIVTSNQREAVIKQGQEVGYVTISGAQTAGTVPIPNVQFKDVLLELRVTPTITNDGRVFMSLVVNKDEIEGFVNTSIGDVPQISTREVTTAVLVEDGQTVVIGGVYEFRNRADISKVPFLGDLPFIGNLFKSRGRSKEKAELLIFVTPKVMHVAQRN
jgi:type IV pilus assembly protein PilQ